MDLELSDEQTWLTFDDLRLVTRDYLFLVVS